MASKRRSGPSSRWCATSFRSASSNRKTRSGESWSRGSTGLELNSPQSYGLLLNMIGLKPPDGALSGLDGVLIGTAHARDAATALGGALPKVAGRAVDRGHTLDRSRVRRGPEQDRQRRRTPQPAHSPYAPARIPASLERRRQRHGAAARSSVRPETSSASCRRGSGLTSCLSLWLGS